MSASELSRGAVNPVIHLIFARCSVILVCWPLGKYNLQCTVLYVKYVVSLFGVKSLEGYGEAQS